MPLSGGMTVKKFLKAPSPPAEATSPATGISHGPHSLDEAPSSPGVADRIPLVTSSLATLSLVAGATSVCGGRSGSGDFLRAMRFAPTFPCDHHRPRLALAPRILAECARTCRTANGSRPCVRESPTTSAASSRLRIRIDCPILTVVALPESDDRLEPPPFPEGT